MKTVKRYPAILMAWLLPLLMLPGAARAAVTCTGWGGQTSQNVALNLPSTVDLPLSSVAGTVLATGSATLPGALRCTDSATGQDVTTTNWSWSGGYDSGTDSILLTRGLGLKLAWMPVAGSSATGGSVPPAGGSASTQGFNWSQLNWSLVRTGNSTGPAQNSLGTVGQGTFSVPGVGLYILRLQQIPTVTVTASCALSTDKSTVQLPDTDAGALSSTGYSDSRPLTAYVTCPANTLIFATLTMSTPQAESSDNTLVGNTGTAKGVAVEVLDNNGNRVSASGGTAQPPRIAQGSSTATPGGSQAFSVRMTHLSGQQVTAGTVQGTFTLTLTVN